MSSAVVLTARGGLPRGLEGFVEVLEWVECDTKLDAFSRADVFVSPSHAEGLLAALPALMIVGLPVTPTSVGSILDVVIGGRHGFLVPMSGSRLLAGAVANPIGDPGHPIGPRRVDTESRFWVKPLLKDFS